MDKAIKVTEKQYSVIRQIAENEGKKIKAVLANAIRNFLISKKYKE